MMFRVVALFCIGCSSIAHALQSRHQDVADTLQARQRDHLGCLNEGAMQFEFPGPCMQMPFTNCTKELLPTVLYLGMPHSGSTSLAVQLNMHPELSYGKIKEHRFFVNAGKVWHTPNTRTEDDGVRNKSSYQGEFQVDCDTKVTFDGTPFYLYLGTEGATCSDLGCLTYPFMTPGVSAVKKVREMLGEDLKLVAMFRDPLDMVTSQYPDAAIYTDVLKDQTWKTCYSDGLDSWLSVFPRKNFLFLDSEEYFKSPQTTIDRVLDFAGLTPKKYSALELESFGRRRSSATRKDILPSRLREAYHAVPFNSRCKQRLETSTGLKFDWLHSNDSDPKYNLPEKDDKDTDPVAALHSILDDVKEVAEKDAAERREAESKGLRPKEDDEEELTYENVCEGRVRCVDAKTIEEKQQCC